MEALSKKLTNLHEKKFLIGFEVECLIYRPLSDGYGYYGNNNDLKEATNKLSDTAVRSKIRNIHKGIVVGSDGSVHRKSDEAKLATTSYEFKTPPLPPKEAFAVLDEMFEFINEYGYTNSTCGLHVNFSPVSDKVYSSLDPLKLLNNKLWTEIKKAFNRQSNSYCYKSPYNNHGKAFAKKKSKKKPKKVTPLDIFTQWFSESEDYYNDGQGYMVAHPNLPSHYSQVDPQKAYECGHGCEVSLDNYTARRRKESRIEVRCMGNKNYHKKYKAIAEFTNKIFNVYKSCCSVKV